MVVRYERERLTKAGKPKLAKKVHHASLEEGDGAGYDIQSFNEDGTAIYIEVKTTVGGIGQPFDISLNEVEFSHKNSEGYRLYRIFNFGSEESSPGLHIVEGSIKDQFSLKPMSYRVSGWNLENK